MVRLNRLAVEGLFSYAERQEVEFSERTVIVGPNNAGKTNLFRAIGMLADALLHDRSLPASEISRPDANPRIEADLSLSSDEIGVLAVFFSCSCADEKDSRAKMISGPNVEKLRDSIGDMTIKIEWKMQGRSGGGPDAEVLFPACGFGLKGGTASNVLRVVPMGAAPRQRLSNLVPFNTFMNAILESGDPQSEAGRFLQSKDVVHREVDLYTHCKAGRSVAEMRLLMRKLNISDRAVSLTRLLGIMLQERIVHAAEDRYLPRENVAETFDSLALHPGEPEGFEFKYNKGLLHGLSAQVSARSPMLKNYENDVERFFSALADPYDDSEMERYDMIKKRFERLFQDRGLGLELITEYVSVKRPRDGSGQFPIRRITVVDKARSVRLPLDRVGAGARGVLHLLASVYGAKDSVVMLDEPGINLHPTMLQEVVDSMDERDSGNQILVITHSPDLLRCEMGRDAHVVHVGNAGGQSRICQDAYKTIRHKKKPRETGHIIDPAVFFAKRVILVEGESDRALLEISGSIAAKDPKYNLPLNNIAVVSVHGKRNFKTYMTLLDECGTSWRILADKDAESSFQSDAVSWVSKDGVEGSGPIYLLKGDLEAFMRDMNPDISAKSRKTSKVRSVLEYTRLMLEKNHDYVSPVTEFLDRCVE